MTAINAQALAILQALQKTVPGIVQRLSGGVIQEAAGAGIAGLLGALARRLSAGASVEDLIARIDAIVMPGPEVDLSNIEADVARKLGGR